MDETYVKHKGKWVYLYRAIDKEGDTLEFMVSEKRDAAAATKFFKKAIVEHGLPEKVTVDKSGANEAALIHLNCMLSLRAMDSGTRGRVDPGSLALLISKRRAKGARAKSVKQL